MGTSKQAAPAQSPVSAPLELLASLASRFPAGWMLYSVGAAPSLTEQQPDIMFGFQAPDGTKILLVVEVKSSVVPRDVPQLSRRLTRTVEQLPEPSVPVVSARYLSRPVQEALTEHGISFIDATGNVRLSSSTPALFISDRGADRDPWRGPGRPRGSLKGPTAARVVRALVDHAPPVSMLQLIERSGASTGATYRVVRFLDEEALISRGDRGRIESVSWRRLLERWSEDYGFLSSNTVTRYVQPRGLPRLLEDLAMHDELGVTVTGSLAAQLWAPYAPARLATLYADDPARAAEQLGLREVPEGGANVLLARPSNDVVLDRTTTVAGVRYAAPSQVAVDLMTGPGRSPAEAKALLDWMESDERAWRR